MSFMCLSIHGYTCHHHLPSLLHSWLSCYAYACNRCSRGSHSSGIRTRTSRGAATSLGAGGAGPRRRSQRRRTAWVPRSPTFLFSKRQAPKHYKSPMFWKCYFEYLYMFDALSYRSWMQTLVAYLSLPCLVNVPWILFRSRSESMLSHA